MGNDVPFKVYASMSKPKCPFLL